MLPWSSDLYQSSHLFCPQSNSREKNFVLNIRVMKFWCSHVTCVEKVDTLHVSCRAHKKWDHCYFYTKTNSAWALLYLSFLQTWWISTRTLLLSFRITQGQGAMRLHWLLMHQWCLPQNADETKPRIQDGIQLVISVFEHRKLLELWQHRHGYPIWNVCVCNSDKTIEPTNNARGFVAPRPTYLWWRGRGSTS